jgi:hypothetical protein
MYSSHLPHACVVGLLLNLDLNAASGDHCGSPNWADRPQQGSRLAETEWGTLGDGFEQWEAKARGLRQLWNRYCYLVDMRENAG